MTKKITCRVLDSTPLSPDNPDLHFGWPVDTQLYPKSKSVVINHPTDTSQTNQKNTGNSLDIYA